VIASLAGQGIDVSLACRVLGVSQSGYYDWKSRPLSPRALRRIWLAGEIADVHKVSHGTYGALRVTAELRYGRADVVGHDAVEAIMQTLRREWGLGLTYRSNEHRNRAPPCWLAHDNRRKQRLGGYPPITVVQHLHRQGI
jgi:HTH-like domain